MEQWMNIKFKNHVEISSETFKISIQELIKFLEEFRSDLQTKIDFLITLETRVIVKEENKSNYPMDQDVEEEDQMMTAAEKVLPYLEGKLRRFSISNSGVSLLKSLNSGEK